MAVNKKKFTGINRLIEIFGYIKAKLDALSARIKQPDWNQTDSTADDYIKNKPTGYVTGVKGNSESTYRSGNVNLTAANVGALPDATVPINKGGTGATTAVNAILNLFGSDSKYRMKYVSSGESIGQITSPKSGLAIWQANDESAGIILTGDGVYIFAPPDEDALIFINEDENSKGWSIDGEGTLKDSNGNEIYMRGGAYLPLSGGTMTGSLTFANGTKNVVGDDCAMGDINDAGVLAIQGQNGNTTLGFVQYGAGWAASSNRANLWFDGSVFWIDAQLDIRPTKTTSNWSEGLRIHSASNGYALVHFCHTDDTGNAGTSVSSWTISKDPAGYFAIYNGQGDKYYLEAYNSAWRFKASGGPEVVIDENGYISGVVHYNMSVITQDDLPSGSSRIVYANSDNWFRYMSVSRLKDLILNWTVIGSYSSGSRQINFSGYRELLIALLDAPQGACYGTMICPISTFPYDVHINNIMIGWINPDGFNFQMTNSNYAVRFWGR